MTYSIKPLPKLFPEHFNLVLDVSEHAALVALYDQDPYLDGPNELLHQALRAGIRALNALTRKHPKDPHEPTRTEVEASKRSRARQNEKSSPRKERSIFPKPHYHVENYIGIPLETRLRIKLEDFLAENQGAMSDEEAFAMLLDLGLEHAEGESPAEVVRRVNSASRRRQTTVHAAPCA